MNIVQSSNGQGRFTAERVARTRPKTYRAIALLLADPDAKIEHIAQRHRVSTHTVRKIREREAVAIAERKQRLVSIFGNVAEIAAERMEELASKASLRDAGTTAGIATDKLLALLGEAGGVPAQVSVQVNVDALHAKYAELVAEISGTQTAESKEATSNGETFLDAPVTTELQSGEELPKSE